MTVYSVKAFDAAAGAYCHEFMTTNKAVVFARKRDHDRSNFQQARVVRPKQWVIDAYVAVGNVID